VNQTKLSLMKFGLPTSTMVSKSENWNRINKSADNVQIGQNIDWLSQALGELSDSGQITHFYAPFQPKHT